MFIGQIPTIDMNTERAEGLGLTTSHNTVYAVRYTHPSTAFGGTSHTPEMLYVICPISIKEHYK